MSEGKYNERCTTSILSTDQIWESWAGPQEATLGWRPQSSPTRSGRSSLSPANEIVHHNPFLDPLLNSFNICNWWFSSFFGTANPPAHRKLCLSPRLPLCRVQQLPDDMTRVYVYRNYLPTESMNWALKFTPIAPSFNLRCYHAWTGYYRPPFNDDVSVLLFPHV